MEVNRINVLISLLEKARIVSGRTRFQKLVFLLQEEAKIPLGYEFKPYHFGPLSFELQNDLNWMVAQGVVIEFVTEFGEGIKRYEYVLSEWGKDYFKEMIEPSMPKNIMDAISSVVEKWGFVEIQKLLDYVHQRYSEYYLPTAHPILE